MIPIAFVSTIDCGFGIMKRTAKSITPAPVIFSVNSSFNSLFKQNRIRKGGKDKMSIKNQYLEYFDEKKGL